MDVGALDDEVVEYFGDVLSVADLVEALHPRLLLLVAERKYQNQVLA